MESEGSLPHSQVPATCPSLEPDQYSPCPLSHFLKIHLNIVLPSTLGSSKLSLSLEFPPEPCIHLSSPSIRATCPVHLILLDLITRIIFDEEYRSLSSSLCRFLHSPVASSLLNSKFSTQHPILKRSQHAFLPQCERPSFRPVQNNRQNYGSVYLKLYIFG